MQKRTNAHLFLPGATTAPEGYYDGKEGHFLLPTGLTPSTATEQPLGLVVEPRHHGADIAIPGGAAGTYTVKLAASPGAVAPGTTLVSNGDGTVKALPTAAGTYLALARAVETGAASELVEAVLLPPTPITIAA
ncbi:MAG: hypothetical protein LBD14_01535 [Puniceicoccales bacterium]|jgi:hypothetical protein|nr:hypothetical protein [Puniceicoccales bacterium]